MMSESLYGFEMRGPDRRENETTRVEINKLWQRSHEILGMSLLGFKNNEIAAMLSIDPNTVSLTLNSELGRKKLSKMREERDGEIINVSKEIAKLQEKALKVYEEIFNCTTVDFKLKKEVADTVLMDIGGHRAPTKVQSESLHYHATKQDIDAFKKRGIQAAKETGMLIELKPKDSDDETV